MTFKKRLSDVVFVMAVAALALASGAASAETTESKIVAAIETIKVLERPGRDTLATVWDGDKYVQCRHISVSA